MDFEVTNMALRSYWMTMGKFFEFSKPQFSQLLWSYYKHQVWYCM